MKLCYYHDNEGNFGDDLNAWLWPKLLPGVIQGIARHGEVYYEENNREAALLYGIGTILDQRIPPLPIKFIVGSGVGYFSSPEIDEKYNIYILSEERKPQKSWVLLRLGKSNKLGRRRLTTNTRGASSSRE